MKSKIIGFLKKQWLAVWICVMVLLLGSVIVSAESIHLLSPLKRVLVTKDGHGVLFSSNILEKVDDNVVSYQAIYKAGVGPYVVDMLLWNFDTSDESTYYHENINYTINAILTDSEGHALDAETIGDRTVTITPTSPSGSALVLSSSNRAGTVSGRLAYSGSSSAENAYTVTFSSNWNLDDDTEICVEITAVPREKDGGGSYTDLAAIGKIIGLRKSRVTGTNGWDAVISEATDLNSPSEFDAYNLVISGSGRATITVSWDTSKIEVNKNVYNPTGNVFGYNIGTEIVDNGTAGGWHTIVIHADTGNLSQNNRNRYTLQLYKLGILSDSADPADWSFFAKNQTAAASQWIRVNIE